MHGHVNEFDVAKRKRVKLLRHGLSILTSLCWSVDGKQIASGNEDGMVVIGMLRVAKEVLFRICIRHKSTPWHGLKTEKELRQRD